MSTAPTGGFFMKFSIDDSVMHGKRERLNDIWFVFGILKFVMIFGNFIGATWIL
jgi:hypothetical protein